MTNRYFSEKVLTLIATTLQLLAQTSELPSRWIWMGLFGFSHYKGKRLNFGQLLFFHNLHANRLILFLSNVGNGILRTPHPILMKFCVITHFKQNLVYAGESWSFQLGETSLGGKGTPACRYPTYVRTCGKKCHKWWNWQFLEHKIFKRFRQFWIDWD